MRNLFFALIVANVLLLAWSLLSPGHEPLAASAPPDVPPIVLAGEVPASAVIARDAASSGCRSIGPFEGEDEATRAAAAFAQEGYDAAPRSEDSRSMEGYWVSLAPARNPAAETQLLARLSRAGITDATVMTTGEERRVSVGIFNEWEGAQRRAGQLRRLGYAPDVTERLRIGTSWWVDLQLHSPEELAEAEAFNRDGNSALQLKVCPEPAAVAAVPQAPAAQVESP